MSLTLCMIVKNESKVIKRCLDSVSTFIDSWCIVDTGSTDGTQDIIRQHLREKPGELVEQPWVRQDINRTQAMQAAARWGTHLLCIDADETLVAADDFLMPKLTEDVYELRVRYGALSYARKQILRASLPWRWVGRVHPYLTAEGVKTSSVLEGLETVAYPDGASWGDPLKYQRHVDMLEEDCAEQPQNARLRYYLAQSYRDAKNPEKARENYLKRVSMSGWAEETWSAAYESAKLSEILKLPSNTVVSDYIFAWRLRPHRAETLYQLARYLCQKGEYVTALVFAKEASKQPLPGDRLFVETDVYTWRVFDVLSVAAYYSGDLLTATCANQKALENAPELVKERLLKNSFFMKTFSSCAS